MANPQIEMNPVPSSTSMIRNLRIILVLGMMLCVAFGISFLFKSVMPNYPLHYFIPLAFLVSLAGLFENSILKKDISGRDKTIFRISGFVVLAIITKGLTISGYDLTAVIQTIKGWGDQFFDEFFQIQFLMIYVSYVIIWFLSNSYAADFQLVDDSAFDPDSDSIRHVMGYVQRVQERIPGKVLFTGVALTVFAVIARINFLNLLESQHLRIEDKSPILHVVIYFILGMALMSNIRYTLLTIRWQWEKSRISQVIGNNWIRYALIFFIIVGILAYLLPTNYTNGILTVLSYILGLIVQLVSAILFIFAYIVSMIIKPFLGADKTENPTQPEAIPTPSLGPAATQITPDWIAAIKPYLFWGIFVLIVGGSFIYYASQNKQIISFFARLNLKTRLTQLVNWIKVFFSTTGKQTAGLIRSGIRFIQEKIPKKSSRIPQPLMEYSDDPKIGIRLLYLSFLDFSTKNALTHRLSDTPIIYKSKLLQSLPESQGPVSIITDEFVKARYTQFKVSEQDVIEFKSAFAFYQQQLIEKIQQDNNKKAGAVSDPR